MLHICTTPPRLSGWDKRRFNDLEEGYRRVLKKWAWTYFYPSEIVRANGGKGFIFKLEQHTAVLDETGNPTETHIRTRSIMVHKKTFKVQSLGAMKLTILKH